jgi:Ricin-type beta-trefoil lectin domain-like
MPTRFFIQSVIGDQWVSYQSELVIGIDTTNDKNYLKAYDIDPKADNQLWTFVPATMIENAFYLQNPATGLVIDIQEEKYEPGTPLVAYTMKNNADETYYWNNQLWYFDPAHSEDRADWYFIVNGESGLAIDIARADTRTDFAKTGTTVDVWTQKKIEPNSNDANNQLWSFVSTDGAFLTPKWSES